MTRFTSLRSRLLATLPALGLAVLSALAATQPAGLAAQSTDDEAVPTVEPRFTRLFGGDSIAISADPAAMLDDRAVAVSPDGRWIAWEGSVGEEGGVWVSPADGGEPTRVSPSGHDYSSNPVWFRDSRRLAFRSGSATFGPYIYVVELDPRTGWPAGPARQATIDPQAQWGFGVSPDGERIAYIIGAGPGQRMLRVVPSNGGSARTLWEGEGPAWWPAWSRDGQDVYFLAGAPGMLREVRRVPVEGGEPEVVHRWDDGLIYASSPDGRYVSRRVPHAEEPLWEIGTVHGETVARFALPEHMAPAGFWPGEAALVAAARNVAAPLWMLPVAGGPARQLTEARAYELALRWMPDGEEIFIETQLDGATVYMLAAVDGSTMRQVALPEPKWGKVAPAISADGRHVAWFTGDETETPVLKVFDARTERVRVVTDSVCRPTQIHPAWSGDRILYCHQERGRHEIRAGTPDGASQLLLAYPADGGSRPYVAVRGERMAFTENDGETGRLLLARPGGEEARTLLALPGAIGSPGMQGPVWSPDGRALVVGYARPDAEDVEALIVPLTPDGDVAGEPTILEMDGGPAWWWDPQWLPDGSGFVTIGMEPDGGTGIWLVSLDPSEAPVELTADDPGPIWAFVLSPDGRRIVYSSERPAGTSVWKVELPLNTERR